MAATRVGGFGVEGHLLHGMASPSRGRRHLLHGSGVIFARAAVAASSSRGQRRWRLLREGNGGGVFFARAAAATSSLRGQQWRRLDRGRCATVLGEGVVDLRKKIWSLSPIRDLAVAQVG
jgi:hypothetical protein